LSAANIAKSRLLTQPYFYFAMAFLVAVGGLSHCASFLGVEATQVRLPLVMALRFFLAMHLHLTSVANSVAFAKLVRWFARI
jgi:hypothetical protein